MKGHVGFLFAAECRDAAFHVMITSYQLLVSDEKYFRRVKWQYMVLDEAQAIKSSTRSPPRPRAHSSSLHAPTHAQPYPAGTPAASLGFSPMCILQCYAHCIVAALRASWDCAAPFHEVEELANSRMQLLSICNSMFPFIPESFFSLITLRLIWVVLLLLSVMQPAVEDPAVLQLPQPTAAHRNPHSEHNGGALGSAALHYAHPLR